MRDAVSTEPEAEAQEIKTVVALAERVRELLVGNDPTAAHGLIGGLCDAILARDAGKKAAAAAAAEEKLARQEEARKADQARLERERDAAAGVGKEDLGDR